MERDPADGEQRDAGPTDTKKRVFLVDDHEVVRRGVADMLESTGEFVVVGEAGTVAQALNRLQGLDVDVAVLDIRLPDGNGIELCREIRSLHPQIGCLMLTSFSHDEALVDAAMAGAHGYALKQIRGNEIIDAVRTVAGGGSTLDPATTRRALERMQRGTEEQQQLAQLSEQERRIFEHIGEGLSNRQIADKMFLAEKTVKNYVSNLLAKLGMSRRTEAAALAARIDERSQRKLYDL
ncbi:MAG: response regulator transcription factor [Acidimicrobiales bacterium]